MHNNANCRHTPSPSKRGRAPRAATFLLDGGTWRLCAPSRHCRYCVYSEWSAARPGSIVTIGIHQRALRRAESPWSTGNAKSIGLGLGCVASRGATAAGHAWRSDLLAATIGIVHLNAEADDAAPGTGRRTASPMPTWSSCRTPNWNDRRGPVSERTFPLEREAVGNIDFNETWPPGLSTVPGRIVKLFAKIGTT